MTKYFIVLSFLSIYTLLYMPEVYKIHFHGGVRNIALMFSVLHVSSFTWRVIGFWYEATENSQTVSCKTFAEENQNLL